MPDPRRVAILISGRGSNMRALVEEAAGYEVALVASNKPEAPGLEWARERGLPTWTRESKGVPRDEFDQLLSETLEEHDVGTVALAGYMRILTPGFIDRWRGRIVNIHPSLLPKYPGLDTHARAIAAGDRVSGCTVHVVTEEVDSGEILGQAEVPVDAGDKPDTLAQRILAAEHELYPRTLAEFVERCLQIRSNA
jgi:phosphoribosylglycinamide formyltransferase-1